MDTNNSKEVPTKSTKRSRSPSSSAPSSSPSSPTPASSHKKPPPPPSPSPVLDASPPPLPSPPSLPTFSMSTVYAKLFESEMRRRVLHDVHEFHHSRKQLQRVGFSDSFREIASMPSFRSRQRRLSSTSTTSSVTAAPPARSIGERPLRPKASCVDLFGKEISPRLETLERFKEAHDTAGGSDASDEEEEDEVEEEEATAPPPLPPSPSTTLLHPHMLAAISATAMQPNDLNKPMGKTLEIVRGMRRKQQLFEQGTTTAANAASPTGLQVFPLPRGGFSVQTRVGPIQVGIPPETIKDSMNMGLKFPSAFIIPKQRFHRWRMISVAEFEFPAYFNFFVLQRAVKLVTTKSTEVALRCVFQESLLGPVDLSHDAIADDFAPTLPREHWPQFAKERLYFGNNDINKLLEFVPLKESSTSHHRHHQRPRCLQADLGNDILVRLEASETEDSFVIIDQQQEPQEPPEGEASEASPPPHPTETFSLASARKPRRHRRSLSDVDQFPSDVNRAGLALLASSSSSAAAAAAGGGGGEDDDQSSAAGGVGWRRRASELDHAALASRLREKELARLPGHVDLPNFRSFSRLLGGRRASYVPPAFGVTLLGTSHGFDRDSSTTGFVVWINGQGLLVDPPPNSTAMLELMGIAASRQIKHVLVTHCHADHDAGTMQKLMLEQNVTILATPTIFKSFVRKYSAVSDIPAERILERITFRACRVGEWLPLLGGHIRVFYSFHTIPTVGFQVRFGGKTLVYSGDTFFHPEEIARLASTEVLTRERAQDLLNFPWDSDLILHECGVAPIHSPLVCLGQLPAEVKTRLYLVHVTASSVAQDENLKGIQLAKDGTQGTLVLLDTLADVTPAAASSVLGHAGTVLNWIRDSSVFATTTSLQTASELVSVLQVREYATGDSFSVGKHELVIVGQGSCNPVSKQRQASRPYEAGDCLVTRDGDDEDQDDNRVVVRSNKFTCLVARVEDVFALPNKEAARLLLEWKKDVERDEFGSMDFVVGSLTRREQVQFTRLFTRHDVRVLQRGDKLWEAGGALKHVYIVQSGEVSVQHCVRDEDKYDASQRQESLWQLARLRRALQQRGEDVMPPVLLCDLPALYHALPVRSTLTVASEQATLFVAPAAEWLEFLRATPALLAKMHDDLCAEATRLDSAPDSPLSSPSPAVVNAAAASSTTSSKSDDDELTSDDDDDDDEGVQDT